MAIFQRGPPNRGKDCSRGLYRLSHQGGDLRSLRGGRVRGEDLNLSVILMYINNNNNNKHDNVYGAVIMAEPLREFTRFI